MNIKKYPIVIELLTEDEGGGFLATVPDLPGCMADGVSDTEAVQCGIEATAAWIERAQAEGRPIPEPKGYFRKRT